jgi:hypothetical protein
MWMEVPFTSGAGDVTVRLQVSSEAGYDVARVYLDGVLKLTRSGTLGWETLTIPGVAAGGHVLRATYATDSSKTVGFNNIEFGRISWH